MKKLYRDVFELILIRPIINAHSIKQARARARAARVKLQRHELATGMSVGDAMDVLERILAAEQLRVSRIIEQQSIHTLPAIAMNPKRLKGEPHD